MEDWSKDFFEMLEGATREFEQFFQDVSEVAETIAEEVQNSIALEFENFCYEIFEPLIEVYNEFESEFRSELDDLLEEDLAISYKVESTPEHHPACVGCQHYHGHVYNGNLLVCGMHPYGWDDDNCPDWESSP